MSVDLLRLLPPGLARVLEVADEFLLLRVDADDGITRLQEGLADLRYVVELRVPVRVGWPGEPLPVAAWRVVVFFRSRLTVS